MKPAIRVSLNGSDVTSKWSDVIESVTITDEAGLKSDTCEIVFDNREGFSAPPIGAELKVWLGYDPEPIYMGRYKVDSWSKSWAPKLLTLSAKAADMTSEFRAPKMRSHHQKTVKEIVEKIAGEHRLQAVVDKAIGARMIEHIDQQNESDMAFLTRLAQRQGATFKVADGKAIFAAKGSKQLPSGKAKTAIAIKPEQISTLTATAGERGGFGAASASYIDPETKRRKSAKAGKGKVEHRDKRLYGSKAEAEAAAKAKYGDLTRGKVSVTVEMPGAPDLFAEALVKLEGFDSDVDREYLAKSITHRYGGGGFTSSISLETEGE